MNEHTKINWNLLIVVLGIVAAYVASENKKLSFKLKDWLDFKVD